MKVGIGLLVDECLLVDLQKQSENNLNLAAKF